MGRRVGLTLLEVVIVTVIIVVLISIIVPSLAGARKTAQRAVCLSNLRNLEYSLNNFVIGHAGKTMPTYAESGKTWSSELVPYSSASDTTDPANPVLKSAVCPTATTGSKNYGTVSRAWGPSATFAPDWDGLTAGPNQAGSYGINAYLLSSNKPNFGIMCAKAVLSGGSQVTGDLLALTTVSLSGGGTNIAGAAVGVSISASGGSTYGSFTPISSQTLPDVAAIYNNLASTAWTAPTVAPTTLDFTAHPVILLNGNPSYSTPPTVIGSGILVVSGTITFNGMTTTLSMHIVTQGQFKKQGGGALTINGAIYSEGDVVVSGGSGLAVSGSVVTLGTFNASGGSFSGNGAPAFDPFSNHGNVTLRANAAQLPVFADCVWVEAWPFTGAPLPPAGTSTDTGIPTQSIGLGRYYINRHSYATNVVFLDGHAETVKLQDLGSLKWSN